MKKKAIIATGVIATIILTVGLVLAAGNFTGTWSTGWGPVNMTQVGNRVSGNYGGSAPGKLNGLVKGNKLYFSWIGDNGGKGRGIFVYGANGNSFTGTWGNGTSYNNGGAWNGSRIR